MKQLENKDHNSNLIIKKSSTTKKYCEILKKSQELLLLSIKENKDFSQWKTENKMKNLPNHNEKLMLSNCENVNLNMNSDNLEEMLLLRKENLNFIQEIVIL